jgi:uncharacterized protein YeaO (DUF488 family)
MKQRGGVMSIHVKRVYDPPEADDGYRVLVDRLWPRGVSQTDAKVDLWLRDISPTTELRRWFGHEVDKWPEFRERYTRQLAEHTELLDLLLDIEHHRTRLTLLFGATDEEHNQAVVLHEVLRHRPPHSHH